MRFTLCFTGLLCWLFGALPVHGAGALPLLKDQFRGTGTVKVTVPLPNGQILIGGNFQTVNGVYQPRLARLNADGSLDQSWAPAVRYEVTEMAVDGDEVYIITPSAVERAHLSDDGHI